MASSYYKPCPELDRCNALIKQYWYSGQYDLCFRGHLELAKQGYPLAECQVGYFYLKGLGVCQNYKQAVYWTERAAQHGDWDAQYNLGTFYEQGVGVAADLEQAKLWYQRAAQQGHALALQKCEELSRENL